VQYIVTEYGVANLGMLTDVQRAGALAEIAHPDFRGELR
jgi:acyl-CoA hydrolase